MTSLPPPNGLSPAALVEWQIMADALGEDVAAPVTGLIEVYAEARVRARVIAEQINKFDMSRLDNLEGVKQFDQLCLMAYRTSDLIGHVLTKLRVTQQARLRPETAYRKATDPRASAKPWEPIT
jgi:hypothetical protein